MRVGAEKLGECINQHFLLNVTLRVIHVSRKQTRELAEPLIAEREIVSVGEHN